MSRRAVPVAAAAALTILLAACGGGTADTTAATSTTSTTSAATTAAPGNGGSDGAVPAPELAGTSWVVTDYIIEGAITNVWPDTEITIEFGADGTVSGSAGCTEYDGDYTTEGPYDEFVEGQPDLNDGQAMTLADLVVTDRSCTPDRVMVQEMEYLDLLDRTGRWLIARGNLNLRTADGSFLLEAEPAG